MSETKKKANDPLYELFEHFLFNRSFEDSTAFTKEVAEEYLAYLDASPAHVPFQSRDGVLKDLQAEAHEMLIKKMYGCAKASKHINYGKVVTVSEDNALNTIDFQAEGDPPEPPAK